MNDVTATRSTVTTNTADPGRFANRPNLGAIIAVIACALACSLPLIGGLVAGSFLDKVFDSPFVTVGVGTVVVIAVAALVQRRKARSATSSSGAGSDACDRFGC